MLSSWEKEWTGCSWDFIAQHKLLRRHLSLGTSAKFQISLSLAWVFSRDKGSGNEGVAKKSLNWRGLYGFRSLMLHPEGANLQVVSKGDHETIQTELISLCSRREMSLDAISSTLRILLASKENVGQRNDFIFKDAANYCCKNVSSQNSSKINIVF